ncbi:hypothetical protein Tco_1114894 [Tanacetum coccineum]
MNGNNFLDWYRKLRIVLKAEQKLNHIEEALPEAPPATATVDVCNAYTCWFNKQQEVSCLMLAKQELFKTVKAFHAYKQDEVLGVCLILTSLSKDYEQIVQNYKMHSMGKTIPGLHDMLKLSEKGLRKKAPVVLATSQGQIKKPKPQALVKGRGKGNSKLVYAPKQKIPPSAKKELSSKDATCYHCNGVESVARILNMVPTKKVGKMPYEIWHEKVSNLSYLKSSLISQEASGSTIDFDEIQRQDAQPIDNTCQRHLEVEHENVEP